MGEDLCWLLVRTAPEGLVWMSWEAHGWPWQRTLCWVYLCAVCEIKSLGWVNSWVSAVLGLSVARGFCYIRVMCFMSKDITLFCSTIKAQLKIVTALIQWQRAEIRPDFYTIDSQNQTFDYHHVKSGPRCWVFNQKDFLFGFCSENQKESRGPEELNALCGPDIRLCETISPHRGEH